MTDRESHAEELQAANFIQASLEGDMHGQIIFGLSSGLPDPEAMIRVFAALFPEIETDRAAVLARLRNRVDQLMRSEFGDG